MATAQAEIVPEPKVHRWTRTEYYKMADAGLFADKHVELIEGKVIEMSPMYSPHATSVTLADEVMREAFGKGWVIRIQLPLTISDISEPEPDLVVVRGNTRDFTNAHPTSADLVVEIAESSLEIDRKYKASLYAKAGIADYWIVNVVNGQLEVCRRPIVDDEAEYGFNYGDKMIFKAGDSISPLAKPEAKIAVAELLP